MDIDVFSTLFSNIWAIFLVILFFAGSIFVHELGHFLAAKKRGLKIERFSIGFGPKLFGWTKDGIEYRISLIPLGGYVALPQLADMGAIEGQSDEDPDRLPPISYADKMIVSVMGAVFNLIFAFILACIIWVVGQPSSTEAQTNTIGYVPQKIALNSETQIDSPSYLAGLLPGDQILEVDGSDAKGFQHIQQLIMTGTGRDENDNPQTIFKIKRGSETQEITLQPALVEFNQASGDKIRVVGMRSAQDMVVYQTMENSPAAAAGIQKGDTLLSVDGIPLYSLLTLSDRINEEGVSSVKLKIDRAGQILEKELQAEKIPLTKPLLLIDNGESQLELLPVSEDSLLVYSTQGEFFENSLNTGDKLLFINAQRIDSTEALIQTIANHPQPNLTFERSGERFGISLSENATATLQPGEEHAMVGIQLLRTSILIHPNPVEQFTSNIKMTFQTLYGLLNQNSDLELQNLTAAPGIARALYHFSLEDFRLLIWFTVLLNINLAILNLLPIPVLDGGHMLFATIGKLRGKPLPIELIAGLQGVFMILLFSLMIYVSFYDVRRWQGDTDAAERMQLERARYLPADFSK